MRICFTLTTGLQKGQVLTTDEDDPFYRAYPRQHYWLGEIHFLVERQPFWCRLSAETAATTGRITNVHGWSVDHTRLTDGDLVEGSGPGVLISIPAAAPVCRTCEGPLRWDKQTLGGTDLPLCSACEEAAGGQEQPVPGYRIVRKLGEGGLGVTYLALRLADAWAVALETLRPESNVSTVEAEKFRRQANILRQLDHPNVVAYRELIEANGRQFLAMEYLPGTDGAQLLKQEGPLPITRAAGLVCELLEGLAHVHDRGFVHRDVKPQNMRLTRRHGRECFLTDFDLGRSYRSTELSGLTMTGAIGGTVMFMPPEQITDYRNVKPTADQYAAAMTLYNLLTDCFAFDKPERLPQYLAMILNEEPVPIRQRRADLPQGLADVIHRALRKDPEERFADVRALRQALLPFAGA